MTKLWQSVVGIRNLRFMLAAGALLVPLAAYAFSGQTGSGPGNYSASAATVDVLATTLFTAPQTVTCMVTVDLTTSTQNVNFNPSGLETMWPEARIGGVNQNSGQGVFANATLLGGYFTAHGTRLFTVNAGQTAQFGCHITNTGDFANARVFGNCQTTYVCE